MTRALDLRKKMIRELRQRLAALKSARGTGRVRRTASVKRRRAKRSRRKLSARARSQLRLQGKYMGYVRQLSAAQKSRVRRVRQEKGWRAAIRIAAGLLRRRSR